MESWSAHLFFKQAVKLFGNDSALKIQNYINNLKRKKIPVIFSLGHLGKITNIDYSLLHESVNRKREVANYNLFTVKKRSGGLRFVHAVNGKLFYLQKFINEEILQKNIPHPASFAFHHSGGIKQCANCHCGCRWLLKFDLKDYFYSINEFMVYKVFKEMGYKNLLSFELARLCTTLRLPKQKSYYLLEKKIYNINYDNDFMEKVKEVPYSIPQPIGVLPQGAPTSPMLSNLAAIGLDESLYKYAQENGFIYTRYADDIIFSAMDLPVNKRIGKIIAEILYLINENGFRENKNKRRVAGPGSKKLVLGLLVDGEYPRISNELLKRIDRIIYSIEKFGFNAVADYEHFKSSYGFYNHVSGLLSFLKDVDYAKWEKYEPRFNNIKNKYQTEFI